MVVDDRQLVLLKRKLEALNYTQYLDPKSANLVQHLVDDLVHTTESYRALKIQSSRQGQEINNFNNQIEVLKKDGARLVSENNELHLKLIDFSEKNEKMCKESYHHTKKLENEIAELSYWKSETVERLRGMEKENSGLKKKLKVVMGIGNDAGKATMETPDDPALRISISRNLSELVHKEKLNDAQAEPQAAPSADPCKVDLVQAANKRIFSLEKELAKNIAELERVQSQLQQCKASVDYKESEIQRLSAEVAKGQDLEKLDLKYRNESNENVIISLNEQVDYLSCQISKLDEEVSEKRKFEEALKNSEKEKMDAVSRLEKSLSENQAIVKKVNELQKTLHNLRAGNSKTGKAMVEERDGAVTKVAELMARLTDVQSGNVNLNILLEAAESDRKKASEKHQNLQNEIRNLQQLLDDARMKRDSLNVQVEALKKEVEDARGEVGKSAEDLQLAQKKILHLEAIKLDQLEVIQNLTEDKELLGVKLEGVQNRLRDVETTAAEGRSAVINLEAKKSKNASEMRRLESNLASAESELEALRNRLKDLNDQKLKLTNTLQVLQTEQQQSGQDLSLFSQQLTEERSRNDEIINHRDQLEMENSRLKSELAVLNNEKQFLSENLATSTHRLKEGQQKLTGTTRELAQLQALPQKLEDLQQSVKEYMEKLGEAESQASTLRVENVKLSEGLQLSRSDVESLKRSLDDVQCEKNNFKLKLEEAEQKLNSNIVSIKALEAEKDREGKNRAALQAELDRVRESLESESHATKELDFSVKSMEQKNRSLQQEIAKQNDEVERLQVLLSEAHECADGSRQREEEARTQYHEVVSRMHKAEASIEELQAELNQTRAQHDTSRNRLQILEEANQKLRVELESKRKEIDMLTTLSLKGDATVQEYMRNLKSVTANFRAAQVRVQELESEIQNRNDALKNSEDKMEELNKALHALDAERDRLQDELDIKTEKISEMTEEIELGHQQCDEFQKMASGHETRLAQSFQRIKDLEEEVQQLQQQNETAMQNLQALKSEHDAIQDEYRAVSEDLEVMVKENQVVSNQLVSIGQNCEKQQEEIQNLHNRLANAEQLVQVKDTELEDLRHVYESAAGENHRLQSTVTQLERDANSREGQLKSKSMELTTMQDAQRSAHSQINQYLVDLQAFEKQVDHLSIQLSRKEEEIEENSREREVLLEELRAAEQVRFELESNQENLRRQMASMDSQIDILKGRLNDSLNEINNLKHSGKLKSGKVQELETLLVHLRSREFKIESDSLKYGEHQKLLEERNRALEEHVSRLELQVSTMQPAVAIAENVGRRDFESGNSGAASLQLQLESTKLQKEILEKELQQAKNQLKGSRLSTEKSTRMGTQISTNSDQEMEKEIMELRMRLEEQDSLLSVSGRDVGKLQKDNAQLLDLLGKLDSEKEHLQTENTTLKSAVQKMQEAVQPGSTRLTSIASTSPGDGKFGSFQAASALQFMNERMEEDGDESEKGLSEFNRLMDDVHEMHPSPSTPHRTRLPRRIDPKGVEGELSGPERKVRQGVELERGAAKASQGISMHRERRSFRQSKR